MWKKDRLVLYQINEFIVKLDHNFSNIIDAYFDDFKAKMENRFTILKTLIEEYEKDMLFCGL